MNPRVRFPTVSSYTAQAGAEPSIPAGITRRAVMPGCTAVLRDGVMIGWIHEDRTGVRAYLRISDPAVATGVPLGPARSLDAAVAAIAAAPEASASSAAWEQR